MSLAERVGITVCSIITLVCALLLIGMWQAKARQNCYHHEHEDPCPPPTWLERQVGRALDEAARLLGS